MRTKRNIKKTSHKIERRKSTRGQTKCVDANGSKGESEKKMSKRVIRYAEQRDGYPNHPNRQTPTAAQRIFFRIQSVEQLGLCVWLFFRFVFLIRPSFNMNVYVDDAVYASAASRKSADRQQQEKSFCKINLFVHRIIFFFAPCLRWSAYVCGCITCKFEKWILLNWRRLWAAFLPCFNFSRHAIMASNARVRCGWINERMLMNELNRELVSKLCVFFHSQLTHCEKWNQTTQYFMSIVLNWMWIMAYNIPSPSRPYRGVTLMDLVSAAHFRPEQCKIQISFNENP